MKKTLIMAAIMMLMVGCAFAQYSDLDKKSENAVSAAEQGVGSTTDAAAAPVAAADAKPKDARKEFNVYTDKFDRKNHYIPSGYMGDHGDIRVDEGCTANAHSGKTCMKIAYSAQGSQGAGWIGIYWQNPANNWGDKKGGYDLKGYNNLTFWAKGEKGGEVISEFKIGGLNGNYPDSDSTSIGPVTLTKEWKEYTIDLKGLDLSYIAGGFELSASANENPGGFEIYLDDIKYVQ